MAEIAEDEIDLVIAEAMGFAGFGTQGGKKRKFGTDEVFVDPNIAAVSRPDPQSHESKGQQAQPAQISKKIGEVPDSTLPARPVVADLSHRQHSSKQLEFKDERGRLQALRSGVLNERGDMAYFLPSFIEDPWKHLRTA